MGIIKRVFRYYRNDMKLSSKLLISHLALILVSTLTILTFFGSSIYNVLIDTTIHAKQQTAFATAASVEAELNKLIDHTKAIATAYHRYTANLRADGYGDKEKFSASYLADTIENACEPQLQSVYRIYLYPEYLESMEHGRLAAYAQSLEHVYGTYWYGIFSCEPQMENLFCPSLYLSPDEIERYGDLAYAEALLHPLDGSVMGYVVAYFSQTPIIEALAENLDVSRGASYIINSRDALVCDSDAELVGAYYINSATVEQIVADGGYATWLGEDIIVGSYPVNRTDWKVVSILPKSDSLQDADRAVTQFFTIYGAVALLSMLLAVFLARSISGRISSVVEQMAQIHHTRPEKITTLAPSRDEVGQLVNSYNSMSESLNELLDRQAETAKSLRLSEFKALQAQINPHFLYNSLDMINWLAAAGEKEQVCDAVQALGKFYKLTLSKKDTFGTVRRETEHAELYVKLQNMRYENRIQFVVDMDENVQDCVMPKLVFQPLVENAILHGIIERPDRAGEVLLAGWRDGEDLVFLIFDNGVGMTAEQSARLTSPDGSEAAPGKTGTNIGVYNTHKRLQLYYGPRYGLTYQSTPGKGTEVYIRIPGETEL